MARFFPLLKETTMMMIMMRIAVLPACISMCCVHAYRGQKGYQSPGTRVRHSCELPCNPGPLKEQSVLLTAEPSLQPPI